MSGIERLLVGRVLGGRYRIEEVIGRGGMAVVYRALDERLGRLVAVKVITSAGSDDGETRERLRQRFFREARSAAALPHHPNVVPLYDYGTDDELKLDFIVMELLRGSDLATRLARSGPPPLAASLKILIEAARGVAVGHRQGLLHRDIKPGNIFLTETHPNEVQVRVVDFGIAKLTDDDDTLGQLTQDGRVPHSPAFASPEQLRGLTNLTPASDVFSLGVLGYQLLVGERPFTESDRNRISLGMQVDPPSLRQRNPAIPGSIDGIIRKALSIDPVDRFVDAGEMAHELERAVRSIGDMPIEPYIGGAAIVTATDTDEGTAPLVGEDDRTRVLATEPEEDHTLLAAPAPAGVADTPLRPIPPGNGPPPTSSLPRRRPEPKPRKRGMGGMLVWLLVLLVLAAAAMWAISEIQREPRVVFVPAAPDSSLLPEVDPVPVEEPQSVELDAYVANQEGQRFYRLGALDSAYYYFERAVELNPEVPSYHRNLGFAMVRLGMYEDAEREIAQSIRMEPDPPTPEPFYYLGTAQLAIGDTASALSNLNEFLARENRPGARAEVERLVEAIRVAQDPPVPLLGETVGPPVADTTPTPPPG